MGGSLGPYTVSSYITAWGDPGCSGTRYRAYDHYGVSSGTLNQISFAPAVGYRGWDCGVLYYQLTADATNTTMLNRWPGWLPNTTCGWQSDQNARFTLSGYADYWRYAQWQ